jgi:tryptophanyl-tRNA synthetase
MEKKRVFSGIRPTSRLHIGNYLGAVKGMLALQETHDCVFGIVDYHGITTPYDPKKFQEQIKEVALDYLACGLDPQKCHLMIQSQVPEHLELAYLLSTIYPVSRLEQLPTYKEKQAENPNYINMGLLYYPILMAADIMIYKADVVPVGKDQLPHLEVTREIARKFNSMFGDVFPEPQPFITKGTYVPSLKGEGKMSKSVEGSYIGLTDSLETIRGKLAGAPTDSGQGKELPKEGGVANLLTLVGLFEGEGRSMKYEEEYKTTGIKYQELKEELAQAIYKELEPIQKRREEFEKNPQLVAKILEDGLIYSQEIASKTLKEVKTVMGLV